MSRPCTIRYSLTAVPYCGRGGGWLGGSAMLPGGAGWRGVARGVDDRAGEATAEAAAGVPEEATFESGCLTGSGTTRTICPMGVIPAMGSLENGKPKATAP